MIKRLNHWICKINTANTATRVFAAFTAILLSVILILGLTTYCVSYGSLMAQMGRERQNVLEQVCGSCEKSLKQVEKSVIKTSSEPLTDEFLADPYGSDSTTMDAVIQELIDFKYSSSLIQSVYLCLPDKNLIVTSNDGIWNEKDFYDLSWKQYLNQTSGSFWLPARNFTTSIQENLTVVSFVYPVSNASSASSTAYYVVNLYESALYNLIRISNPVKTEALSIFDANGSVVATDTEGIMRNVTFSSAQIADWTASQDSGKMSFMFSGDTYLISVTESDYNSWVYAYTVSKDQIIQPISSIKILSGFSAIGCFLIGTLFLLVILTKIWKPVSNMIAAVTNYNQQYHFYESSNARPNEMELLRKVFDNVIENNKTLRSELDKNHAALKEGFLFNLISNSLDVELDWKKQLEVYHIPFSYSMFYVFIVSIDQYQLLCRSVSSEARLGYINAIKNISTVLVNENGYGMVEQISRNNCIIIFNTDRKEPETLSMANLIREQVENNTGITVTLAISSGEEQAEKIMRAFYEAQDKLDFRTVLGGNRLIVQDYPDPAEAPGTLLTALQEEWLKKNLTGGNIGEIEHYLSDIVHKEIQDFNYDPEEILQIYYFVLIQTTKIIYENGWSMSEILDRNTNLFREMLEYENILDMKNWLVSILERLKEFITGKKEAKNQAVMEQILNYIDNNYSSDISLNMIADNVYLNPSYVSRIFKKTLGKNYIDYLTQVRVERAKELLRTSNKKINEITQKVNLGNTQNFIRIFKKYEGVTPGRYRTQYIEQNFDENT